MPAETATQFREVLRIDPKDSEARSSLISLSVKSRQYDETTRLLEEDARLNPQNPDSQYRLGVMYAFRKNTEGAFTQFQETLMLKQDHARALNAIGKLYLKKGEKEKARDSFAAARAADPNFMEPVELLSKLNTTTQKHAAVATKKKSFAKKRLASSKRSTISKKKHRESR
jgi:Flp pilus assembly protein TadD